MRQPNGAGVYREKVDVRERRREREGGKGRNDPRRLMTSRRAKSAEKLRLQVVGAFLRLRDGQRRYSASVRNV